MGGSTILLLLSAQSFVGVIPPPVIPNVPGTPILFDMESPWTGQVATFPEWAYAALPVQPPLTITEYERGTAGGVMVAIQGTVGPQTGHGNEDPVLGPNGVLTINMEGTSSQFGVITIIGGISTNQAIGGTIGGE